MLHWKTKTSKVIHTNPYFQLYEDAVIRPDGEPGTYNYIKTNGVCLVVAIDEEDKILFITQERYPTHQQSIEIVAGGINAGEEILVAAKRELQEETGYSAAAWKQLAITYPANGLLDEANYVFLATELSYIGGDAQAEEGIQGVRHIAWPEALHMIQAGEITDQQTISSLLLAARECNVSVS